MMVNPYSGRGFKGEDLSDTTAIDHRLTGSPEEIYQKGFHDGYLEGTKWAIKAMEEYEATILRPIIITAPPKEDL